MRRRTALSVLTFAALVEMVQHLAIPGRAQAHRWSVPAALVGLLTVAAVLDMVLSVALRDTTPERSFPPPRTT